MPFSLPQLYIRKCNRCFIRRGRALAPLENAYFVHRSLPKSSEEFQSDIGPWEEFWETIEGTARYAEYYMAGYFGKIPIGGIGRCDSLFKRFVDYPADADFEKKQVFVNRTEIMPAYYYVTGFNLCRLLDKLGIAYKRSLFDQPGKGLYAILLREVQQVKGLKH